MVWINHAGRVFPWPIILGAGRRQVNALRRSHRQNLSSGHKFGTKANLVAKQISDAIVYCERKQRAYLKPAGNEGNVDTGTIGATRIDGVDNIRPDASDSILRNAL